MKESILSSYRFTGRRWSYGLCRPLCIELLHEQGFIVGSSRPNPEFPFGSIDFTRVLTPAECSHYQVFILPALRPMKLGMAMLTMPNGIVEAISPVCGGETFEDAELMDLLDGPVSMIALPSCYRTLAYQSDQNIAPLNLTASCFLRAAIIPDSSDVFGVAILGSKKLFKPAHDWNS